MIAACDTFRSGAVEQLKVHCDRLNVELYSQGYGKDASGVAFAAVQKATKEKTNVVLIDTAGRMQENEPLMKALSTVCSLPYYIYSFFFYLLFIPSPSLS